MKVELVHIGFGNVIAANRILAVIIPDSAPIKRMIKDSRERNSLIDVTYGRKTKAVIVLDSGHLVLAAIQPETIAGRLNLQRDGAQRDGMQREGLQREGHSLPQEGHSEAASG